MTDSRGRTYFDGTSSLWANVHGHRHPVIDRAVRSQLRKVAHSTFLGLTHEPGILLARELVRLAPKGLARVFYSDNGSTAVEAALKMAFQHHRQKPGKPELRPEFLTLENSYHGDTIGSVSLGGIGLFHAKFRPLLFKTRSVMSPRCSACPYNRARTGTSPAPPVFYRYRGERPRPGDVRAETKCRWECLGQVESALKKSGRRISAAVIEPVVQGAGGIVVMPPGYLRGFADLCRRAGVLLIADEVATGFGRTGRLFACGHEGVAPDILCLAKGITGGYLPLAATLATEKIYRSFLGRHEDFRTFFHGHTYTANPLACAAALANISLLKKNRSLAKVKDAAEALRRALAERVAAHPRAGEIRQAGLMAAVDIVEARAGSRPFPPGARAAKRVCMKLRDEGVLLRPLGDALVLMPPLTSTPAEMRALAGRILRAMARVRWNAFS